MRNIIICCAIAALSVAGLAYPDDAVAQQASDKGISEMQRLREEIDRMVDRDAIRELPITYCYYVHKKDIDGIVGLFTSDGKLVLSADLGSGAEGTQALTALYKKSIADADPWPANYNHHIELLGNNRAKGSIYAEIRYGSHGYKTVAIGVYEDEYQKVDGAWRFKSRIFKSHSVAN